MGKSKTPEVRFKEFEEEWEESKFGKIFIERRDKTEFENEDTLLSCAITGMYLNTELFTHQRGQSNIGYIKVKKGDLILSAQNLHLGNANINLRFDHGIISPAYKVYELVNCIPTFAQAWVKQDKTKNYFLSATTEGASVCRKNVIWEWLYNQHFYIPSSSEQKKIGNYFTFIDNKINYQQQKYEKLQNIKKSCLEKMFPENSSNVPELRFKGFSVPWKEQKLKDIFDCNVPNNTLSRAELNYKEGSVYDVHYGDVLIEYGSILNVKIAKLPYITNKSEKDFIGQYLKDGDIVFADTAEDETVGKACEITNSQDCNIVSGLHTMVCRPKQKFAPFYLGYYINSTSYHKQLLPLMQGIKVLSLSKSNMQNTLIQYPIQIEEQQQIGNFFNHLDELITLQKQELEKLQNIKKSCLEKMFI